MPGSPHGFVGSLFVFWDRLSDFLLAPADMEFPFIVLFPVHQHGQKIIVDVEFLIKRIQIRIELTPKSHPVHFHRLKNYRPASLPIIPDILLEEAPLSERCSPLGGKRKVLWVLQRALCSEKCSLPQTSSYPQLCLGHMDTGIPLLPEKTISPAPAGSRV